MPTREIWHELLVHATPLELYKAVSEPAKIAHWWTTDVRGESAIGKHLEFWFGNFCASIMQVTALEPDERVRWRTTGGGASDWIDTEVEFKIFSEGERTFLHFRHSNWRQDARMFPHCSMGWAIFLLSLKEFVETGKGRPYPYDMPVNLWTPPPQNEQSAA